MTAFTPADIPTNVKTLEQLIVWAGQALTRCNPDTKVLELPLAASQPVAQAILIRADDGSYRMVIRASIKVADDYASKTVKFWENALPLSGTLLPDAFKSN